MKSVLLVILRAPDKVRTLMSIMLISSPNPMFDHLIESSHRDDSNKWSNIGFGEEIITQVESIEIHFTHLIWCSESYTPLSLRMAIIYQILCLAKLPY